MLPEPRLFQGLLSPDLLEKAYWILVYGYVEPDCIWCREAMAQKIKPLMKANEKIITFGNATVIIDESLPENRIVIGHQKMRNRILNYGINPVVHVDITDA